MEKQNDKKQQKRITSIGGSALIEGIMMRGPKRTTVACRVDKDTIHTEDIEVKPLFKSKFWKLPLIRGIAGMIDSMRLSYKALGLSADKALEAGLVEEEEPSKFEKWLEDKFGDKLMNVIMVIASILGVVLALGLFVADKAQYRRYERRLDKSYQVSVRGRVEDTAVLGLSAPCIAHGGYEARIQVSRSRAQDHILL